MAATAVLCFKLLTFIMIFLLTNSQESLSQMSPKMAYFQDFKHHSNTISKAAIVHEITKRSANPILGSKRSLNEGVRILDTNSVETSNTGKFTNTRNVEGPSGKSRAIEFPDKVDKSIETDARATVSQERQNNPDIKDIITGIVKLLNGNVNVQANTQPALYRPPPRPYNTRINNRGPPRISEAPSLPPQPTKIPPPYPFYKPDTSMHPFINGVPIPERIVPPFVAPSRLPVHPVRRPPVSIPSGSSGAPSIITTTEIAGDDQHSTETTTFEKPDTLLKIPTPAQEVWETVNMSSNSVVTVLEEKPDIDVSKETEAYIYDKTTSTTNSSSTQDQITPSTTDAPSAPPTKIKLKTSTDSIVLESSMHDDTITSAISSYTPTPSISISVQMKTISSTTEPVKVSTSDLPLPFTNFPYPKPGIVLDDPEFKPGLKKPIIQPVITATAPLPPPGYGEIFDITVSAIQGSGSAKPLNGFPGDVEVETIELGQPVNKGDIIVSPYGNEGFVSIDGKRTYLNLFGDNTVTKTSAPVVHSTSVITQTASHIGTAVPALLSPPPKAQNKPIHIPSRRPSPPVRIDTCIVGDDSTCDQTQNERCKTEIGVSSCHCRPGYTRRKHREACRKMVSLMLSLRVDRLYQNRINWDPSFNDPVSEPRRKMTYEVIRAISSAMSMTPFSDDYLDAKVNRIYKGDTETGGVWVNMTMNLSENSETIRPATRGEIQKHLLGVIHRRNNNVGNSAVYVDSPLGAVAHVQDLDECTDPDLNDCHTLAKCINVWGSFKCECPVVLKDPFREQVNRAGRMCERCPDEYCNNRGECKYEESTQVCACSGNYYGAQCEIDGEVLGVAVGASVAAIIIIGLTLGFLVMWSRRWNREQKSSAVCSPVFGYMTAANAGVKIPGGNNTQPTYLTAEDRMRWAQIADVMAQSNLYAAEPVAAPRPASAMYGYPAMGSMSMAGTLPIHQRGVAPPVALPRLGMHMNRQSYPAPFDNSSSSEEEDRTDLLGRGGFQIARPKSRSSGSLINLGASQSIYCDVDYEPSRSEIYPGLPMSTYSLSARPPFYR